VTLAALVLRASDQSPPEFPLGVFRNNYLRSFKGAQATCREGDYCFAEASSSADPAIFSHNSLDSGLVIDPDKGPSYLDEGTTPLCTAAEVNALADMTASGNVEECEVIEGFSLRLASGSLCIDAGTPEGAPAHDIDGDLRGPSPDIGADEL
jgi:hypothetical protein